MMKAQRGVLNLIREVNEDFFLVQDLPVYPKEALLPEYSIILPCSFLSEFFTMDD
jgi:hypothetical protein